MIKFEDAVHEAENLSEELKTYAEEGPLKKLDDLISRIRIFMIDEKRYDKRYRRDLQKLVRNIPKEKFNTIIEVDSKETDLSLQFASDTNFIITKVEMGEPLHGSCNLCPDVIIKNHEK
jgi:hypothetical protein